MRCRRPMITFVPLAISARFASLLTKVSTARGSAFKQANYSTRSNSEFIFLTVLSKSSSGHKQSSDLTDAQKDPAMPLLLNDFDYLWLISNCR